MQQRYPLKDLNTWRVGGSCELFCEPETATEACSAARECLAAGRELYILGGGSNVLIADGLLPAAVLCTGRLARASIERSVLADSYKVTLGAGFSTRELLAFALENCFGGLEFLTGIPGTIGGALWGSAGADGESLGAIVTSVETLERDGSERTYGRDELNWLYRSCPLDADKTLLALSCTLELRESPREQMVERIRHFALLKKGQPLGRRTAGCVFKNPPGAAAGKMLDEAGCKGLRVGGAAVSQSHANFIENDGGALASDIYKLCELCRRRVEERYGVSLEYEIRFIGSFEEN